MNEETIVDFPDFGKIIHHPEKPRVLPHLQPTADVLASAIEPKHANTIVRKLNHIAPLEGLRHVKRVRKTCLDGGKSQLFVILCMASARDSESCCMTEDVQELVKTYQLSTFNAKVCKYAASTKEEWEEQCKLWPTSFHPPTYNIDGITGFSEEDSTSVFNFMKHAVSMAKSGTRVVNAVVIVDPATSQIIASACDEIECSNDLMSTTSREPHFAEYLVETAEHDANKNEKDPKLLSGFLSKEAKQSHHYVACLHPWRWPEQLPHSDSDSWHPLRHAVMAAIENSAARDRQLFPLNEQDIEFAQEHCSVSSPIASPIKRQKINTNVKDEERIDGHMNCLQSEKTRPYLCTGYDIYFAWEPCIMCAMAIVHQRIKRVFYVFPNPNNGALGSVHRLQGERSLNHHYAVFQVVLPQEILKTEASPTPYKI